jgi:putative peptide zinc metalloprotease protein
MQPSSIGNPDFAVREIEVSTPRVREGLRWTFQESGGEGCYLLEDPMNGRFFRLGRREHHFVKSLDGRRTVAQIVAALSGGDRELAIEGNDAASLVRMLIDNGLVVTGDSEHADRVWDEVNRQHETKRAFGKMGQWMFLKLPMGNPDRFFAWLANRLGWLVSPGFFVIWLAALIWGGLAIYDQAERFRSQMSGVFDFGNLWMLGGLWIVMKAFHECWHGLVCRKFGGVVPEAGVTLLLLTTPLGYVNASSSAAFPSKWQRIAVAAAGMYGELFIAALAAVWWARVEPGPLSAALHQVVVLSSVTTVLFNANPLMRFDGYYILSDLLDIPNLYGKGQSVTRWLLRRWVLGMKKAKFPLRPGERGWLIGIYGVASGIWRFFVMIGLLVASAYLFEGIGLILTAIAVVSMVVQGISGTFKYLRKSAAAEGLRPGLLLLRITALTGLLITALCLIRVTPTVSAPAVVRDASGGEVRAECPGFLAEIGARDGTHVKEGDLLFRLENAQETARLKKLESEIERSRLRREQFLAADQLASWQAEDRNLAALEATASELREFVATLERRAPRDGVVQCRQIASLEGTWVEPGRLLISVGTDEMKELVILAQQEDWPAFKDAQATGREIRFYPRGRLSAHQALLREVVPRATLEPSHFALITPAGGPLAVKRKAGSGDSADGLSQYELTRPRFEIKADLSDGLQGDQLADGEPGKVTTGESETQSLAGLTWDYLQRRWDALVSAKTGT